VRSIGATSGLARVTDWTVLDALVVKVNDAVKPSVNPVELSLQGVVVVSTRQLFSREAGTTNLGSALESTETVDEAIAAPLVPND
jgi:hypothetical protein